MFMMSRKSTRVMESQEEKCRKGGRAKGKNMSLVRRVLNIIHGFKRHLHHSLAVWLYTSHFLSPGLMVKLVQGTLLLLCISAPVSFYSLNLNMTSEYHSTWQSRSHNWNNTTTTFGLDYLSGDFQFSLLCFKFWKRGCGEWDSGSMFMEWGKKIWGKKELKWGQLGWWGGFLSILWTAWLYSKLLTIKCIVSVPSGDGW